MKPFNPVILLESINSMTGKTTWGTPSTSLS
jgi:hypothetical protein